ncbi:hypothetical protein JHK85_001436 [Glycine max]|nr:hypothetical protein JHK85_001436 [Glycine max]KAG5088789.1 hypothetical protein JHK86_001401 [Glycine max]
MRDELDRKKYPRMPWHNVHCALWGPPCRDIARHFVQHWNHAKQPNKNPKNKITVIPAEEEEIWGAFFKMMIGVHILLGTSDALLSTMDMEML